MRFFSWIKCVQLMLHLVPSRHWKLMLQSEIQAALTYAVKDYQVFPLTHHI